MSKAIVPSPERAPSVLARPAHHRPRAKTLELWDAISSVVADYERMTVRQLFYQLVSREHIDKTEREYKRVSRTSVNMRRAGALPYKKIVDNNRDKVTARTQTGLVDALEDMAADYRRDPWLAQPRYVEVWVEKDALSGIIQPICTNHFVPFLACRGFTSETVRHITARKIITSEKPATILYLGDHDPSGRAMGDGLAEQLRGHGADVTVQRIALEPDQIRQYNLPTRPSKKSDSRHHRFVEEYGNASVELDALPPDVLEALVTNAIASLIDVTAWNTHMQEVREEQEHLWRIVERLTA
jgi:hypothetical protein